jgi:cardiolipin synthase A/B
MNKLITGNEITLLCNGNAYFPALETAIHHATMEVYLQTYIFELDESGIKIGNALKAAALRNVEVNLLLDGFGCKNFPNDYMDELKSCGVNIAIYRPKISPWTLNPSRLQRMHRKMSVIDGKVGFVGGINIIDDYNTPNQTPPRVDYAVKVEGPLIAQMQHSAALLWRRVTGALQT